MRFVCREIGDAAGHRLQSKLGRQLRRSNAGKDCGIRLEDKASYLAGNCNVNIGRTDKRTHHQVRTAAQKVV